MLFAPRTLGQLLWLRSALNTARRTDRFLMALLTGVLHRNADTRGMPQGLTVAMPNTFSMAPGYIEKYIQAHDLKPPDVDVLDLLERQVSRIELPQRDYVRGRAWRADAAARIRWPAEADKAKLVLSSPPYLQVVLYGKYNWLRLWLIGAEHKRVDDALFTSQSPRLYMEFLSGMLANAKEVLRDDGFVCLVIGDVRRGDTNLNLASRVASECVPDGLRVLGVVADHIPVEHKVTRIWKDGRGNATKTDRLLVLGGPRAKPGDLGRIKWR